MKPESPDESSFPPPPLLYLSLCLRDQVVHALVVVGVTSPEGVVSVVGEEKQGGVT